MRYQGRIGEWKDDRGFGFITPNGGGPRVFLHISSPGTLTASSSNPA
jgi:cold shock CspA family protein